MEKKMNNEELQNRREFFKKSAKGILPILGAIVLASTPAIVSAHSSLPSSECQGCTGLCTGCTGCTSCSGLCEGQCIGCTGCSVNCYGKVR